MCQMLNTFSEIRKYELKRSHVFFIQERKFISSILVSISLDGGETVGVLKLLARVVIVHVECDDATLSKDGWDARIEIPVERTYRVEHHVSDPG